MEKGLYDKLTFRNIGIFSTAEQEKLRNSCVAIAGVGGVGGLLAERLIRIGLGKLKISDPGTFEPTNFNRQFASNIKTVDRNKAEAVYRELIDINPEAVIEYDTKGIKTQEDADKLAEGASVVVDEMDFPMLKQSIYLQRAARNKGIYYVFSAAIGFGAITTIFSPEGCSLEEYNGLPKDVDLENVTSAPISFEKAIPQMPSYAFEVATMQEVKQMIDGKRPISTNSIGVGLSSILTSSEAVNILIGKKRPVVAPKFIHLDLLDKSFIVKEQNLAF